VATSDSRVTIEEEESDENEDGRSKWVECPASPDAIDADEQTVTRARLGVSRALQRYYEGGGLEGLVEEMYSEAPFEVQRKFRQLDQQLTEAAEDDQQGTTGDCDREAIRETLHDLVRCFPRDDFPAYEDDLHVWYRLMSAELDSDTYAPTRTKELAQTFWRLFSLELACRENNGLSREDIADERDLESVEAAKDEIRSRLRMYEREKARQNGQGDDVTAEAADALVAAHLDTDVAL